MRQPYAQHSPPRVHEVGGPWTGSARVLAHDLFSVRERRRGDFGFVFALRVLRFSGTGWLERGLYYDAFAQLPAKLSCNMYTVSLQRLRRCLAVALDTC
jgi:hypothetical protein